MLERGGRSSNAIFELEMLKHVRGLGVSYRLKYVKHSLCGPMMCGMLMIRDSFIFPSIGSVMKSKLSVTEDLSRVQEKFVRLYKGSGSMSRAIRFASRVLPLTHSSSKESSP